MIGGEHQTVEEALGVLGLDRDATREAVKAAYRALAKILHPDGGGTDNERWYRVQAACDFLIRHLDAKGRDSFEEDDFEPDEPDEDRIRACLDPEFRVRQFMCRKGLVFRFDGTVAPRNGWQTSYNREKFATILGQVEETEETLLDAIRIANKL